MKNKKKMLLAGALALVMVGSAIGGTLAYLTDTSSLDNVFLVGAFTKPTEPKPDPDPPKPDPTDPDPEVPTDDQKGKPDGYIFEPYWNANGSPDYTGKDSHRLLAGETTVKDPYIGIGKDSESGYVLACITNPMAPHVYFQLSEGWEPVEGYVTEVTITDANGSKPAVTADEPKFYSQGLFKWVGDNDDGSLKALTPADNNSDGKGDADAWTDHPVFTYVYTAKNGLEDIQKLEEANHKMTVWAYIAQSEGTQDGSEDAITSDYVIEQAKAWAVKTEAGYPGYVNPEP